ncbi:MAG: TonB-dependent receptor, partial [Bacteroidales bacterium]|nr:TonB-dependent receptor [Bacteroidales bacterium]
MKKHLTLMKKLTVLVLLFACWTAQAQVTTASMSGRVSSGNETLPGATVKATHVPSGTVYGITTRMDGTYTLANMRIGGPYIVQFSFVGYQPQNFENISLTLGENLTLNVSLTEGVALEGVVVTGFQSTVMNSNRTGAQEVITRETMDRLPTINRSLNDFTRLAPMNNSGNLAGISYRFNNVTVDGASFNNSFGLSSALGASGTEPISLEALEQVQVMIAPYDVRNGGFTGGAINSVTKSGSNEFKASAYTYAKGPALMGYRAKEEIIAVSEFSNKQYGISLSGALIPNKLFFFINGELDRQDSPITFTTKNSAADASVLKDITEWLDQHLNYDPGFFDKDKRETEANRLTVRFDYNLDAKNSLSLKYYHLRSFNTVNPSTSGQPNGGRGPNQFSIPFSSCFYRTNNNFDIVMLDLNSTINNKMSNMFR